MSLFLVGMRGVGKTTAGALAAGYLGVAFVDADRAIEDRAQRSVAEIFQAEGEAGFRRQEREALLHLFPRPGQIVATGGGGVLDPDIRRALRRYGQVLLLRASVPELSSRLRSASVARPSLTGQDPADEVSLVLQQREPLYRECADIFIETSGRTLEEVAHVIEHLGTFFRITTFGESHGPAVGTVIDGVPPRFAVDLEAIQRELHRRRPGQSHLVTPRKEADQVEVLSGLFEGQTTGAPLCLLIRNHDASPEAYDELREVFRPGHADFTTFKKYGVRDHRGGGRASGRETAARVAAGAVARQLLAPLGVVLTGHALEIAGITARTFDPETIEQNLVRCADSEAAQVMVQAIEAARAAGDSVGGVVEVRALGVPPGWGDPVFGKLDAQLAAALMSIGGVKGVEIGDGFALARTRGSQANDPILADGAFAANRAGGILGGISTGAPLIVRAAVKPTPSISLPQPTVDLEDRPRLIEVRGRHDPCIVPRLVPVAEAMAAVVLVDAYLAQRACGEPVA